VGLSGLQDRRITNLSGGQAQRAALARAMVKRPAVLLLDEPLGALDLRLRRQMQDELARLKGNTGTTFVHVTHDQEEACAIADRIAVMDRGCVIQVDTPMALFSSPRTSYVAEFIDAGTIVRGASERRGDVIELTNEGICVKGPAPSWLNGSGSVAAVLAPQRINVEVLPAEASPEAAGADRAHGEVQRVVFTGSLFDVYVRVRDDLEVRAALSLGEVGRLGDALAPGTLVNLSWSPDDVIFVEDVDPVIDEPMAEQTQPVPVS
jgi:ABC-type Fe3+/spermidine/putrescine transport system ATPase subunit